MSKVFISYRREDTSGYVGRLQEKLSTYIGRKKIFVDVESIRPGSDFAKSIDKSVNTADVILIVIGKEWVSALNEDGKRRLDDPEDYVRQEVNKALMSKAKVLPVLVKGAKMPSPDELPEPLKPLATLSAVELRDTRWEADVEHLIQNLGGISFLRRMFRRRIVKVFSVLLLLGLIVGGYVYFLTEKVANSVENFLALLAQDKIEQAYLSTSAPFKSQVTQESFAREILRLGLQDNSSASWTSRELGGGKAILKGSVMTKQRSSIPLAITLIKEEGKWKILKIEGPSAGLQNASNSFPMPSDSALQILARKTLTDLDDAIMRKDFTLLHEHSAQALQKELDPDDFKKSFQSFIEQDLRLGPLSDQPLVFTKSPIIDDSGILRLEGYHQEEVARLSFLLEYLYEYADWKLVGISVDLKKSDSRETEAPKVKF
jgi:hypothetical protein